MSEPNRKHVRRIAKQFDAQASRYDRSGTVRWFQSRAQAHVLSRIEFRPGMRVLDLGCGTGTGTREIARRIGPSGAAVGMDASPKMIAEAERKCGAPGSGRASFVVGCAEELDERSTFDVVVCTNVFHHLLDKADVFRRVLFALRPDGTFLVEDICNDSWKMRALDRLGRLGERAHVGSVRSRELVRLMEDAGFAEVTVNRVRLTWFWEIMVGRGRKPTVVVPSNDEERAPDG
jgi:ubiquinone/menaquinone biosynthesis C-methylase UbiE